MEMNTRINAGRRHKEDIANAEVPHCGDQVHPLEEGLIDDQALTNPPPLTNENLMDALI